MNTDKFKQLTDAGGGAELMRVAALMPKEAECSSS